MQNDPPATADTLTHDVIICGAGPAGCALALLLAERRNADELGRIALVDARPAGSARSAGDARLIAISAGSRSTLARLGAWSDASVTPIERIHVSHRGHFGRTLIDRRDYAIPALGYVIAYSDLLGQLEDACARRGFTRIAPVRVAAVTQDAACARVQLDDGRVLAARYAVRAEGGLFDDQAPRAVHRDYEQTAITATVRCALPQAGVAWERFTEEGPIALLPLRQRERGQSATAYALVWCGAPAEAARRMTEDDAAFLAELHQAFGDRLGRFTSVGPRQAFALGLNASAQLADGRVFAIGNAAQTLHPVAGQGMNLALRDAVSLATALGNHFDDAGACGAAYVHARRIDRRATIRITDLLPRVFASPLTPVVKARGAALAVLDIIPQTRHWLARQMMDGQR